MLLPYDIFKRDGHGTLLLVEATKDLETAKARIIELSAQAPGQYIIFDHKTGQRVSGATIVASGAPHGERRKAAGEGVPREDFVVLPARNSATLWK
jgi:hypothetical protein